VTLSNARLTSFPQRASTSEYDVAAAELESLLSELPGALAVYRFGSVGVPGISDIDRLLVVQTTGPLPDQWKRLSAPTRYLAMHGPFVVDSRTFAYHRWFSDAGPLELAFGTPTEIKACPYPVYSKALIAAEHLVVTLLKLNKLGTTGRAKVRSLLCELNTVRIDLELADLGREAAPQAWQLVDQVATLRDTWWALDELDRTSRVRRVLSIAFSGVWEALATLGAKYIDDEQVQELPLRAEWSRVMLVPRDSSRSGLSRTRPQLVGRNRRLGEALWRVVPRRVTVPAAALGLIGGMSRADHSEFKTERTEILRRYDALMVGASGYSSLGVARVFLQP
jgi:hypothetical protein